MQSDSIALLARTEAPQANVHRRAKAVVFSDPRSQALLRQIERVAPSDASVLIRGETGTGKELIARHLHACSKRNGPFMAANCGALSAALIEAELFGHQAGSFTGASETRAGWFEAANGGTLFLDEIGDLPLAMQVKLLRVLQEREVVRVGSRKSIPIDVRVIAATNIDLAQAAATGAFRMDLYYRLSVVTLNLPALRERSADILPLFEHFLGLYGERMQMARPSVASETRALLLGHHWPGNIRELENVAHSALLVVEGDTVLPEHVHFAAVPYAPDTPDTSPQGSRFAGIREQLDRLFGEPPPDLYQQLEELIVRQAFERCRNNQVHTAKLLGVTRNVLRTLLKRYGLISSDSRIDDCDSQTTEAARLHAWSFEARA
ncbi:MAG TPA: sigma-54 dependent transcriptional regulator [Steroidobacteraceae bacterium]|nr:sigma-54 dependent transcriptional regulator [Steroidobacteraceae bacterium]